MSPRLPLLAVLLLVSSIVTAATLTPETPLSPPRLHAAPNPQYFPALATDGTQFFSVWTDERTGDRDIYGARLDTSGSPLDERGIALHPTPLREQQGDVVWNGRAYVAVFASNEAGVTAVEIAPDGTILRDVALVTTPGVFYAAIAWSGTSHLVVWSDGDSIVGQRFDRDLQPSGSRQTVASGLQPVVASNGIDFLAAWTTRSGSSRFATISSTGSVAASRELTSSRTTNIGIASNGSSYLLVASTVSDGEALLVSDQGEIRRRAGLGTMINPAVAWDGVRYVAAWNRDGRLVGATFDGSGLVTRGPARLVAGNTNQGDPAIAANAEAVALTWTEEGEIRSATFAPASFASGQMATSTLVTASVAHEVPLDAAWNRDRLVVLTREGDLTSDPRLMLDGEDLGRGERGAVAVAGGKVAVVYTSLDAPYVRVGGVTTRLDDDRASQVAIAAAGPELGVLWTRMASQSGAPAVHVARVDTSGAITAAPHAISPPPGNGYDFYTSGSIVWTGSEFVVLLVSQTPVLVGRFTHFQPDSFLLRLDRDLNPIAAPVQLRYEPWSWMPDLATNGKDVAVVWTSTVGSTPALQVRRYTTEGEPIGDAVLLAAEPFSEPRIEWDGSDYVVAAWVRRNSETSAVTTWVGAERTSFAFADPQLGVAHAALLAPGPGGRTALLYTRPVPLAPRGFAMRGFLRFLGRGKVRAARK